MQGQVNGAAGLATLEAAQPLGWRAAAIGEHEQPLPTRLADLRTELAAQIQALIGRPISPEDIYANQGLAVAGVDGVTFRLHHRGLVLMHPCIYCGTGHFESPKITGLSDLGYALSAWRPLHKDCEDYSSEELPDF